MTGKAPRAASTVIVAALEEMDCMLMEVVRVRRDGGSMEIWALPSGERFILETNDRGGFEIYNAIEDRAIADIIKAMKARCGVKA